MNNFATIELLDEFIFDRVTYYSIKLEDKDVNEFEDFILNHQDNEDISEEFDDIINWLEVIGEDFGAQRNLFRNEQKAEALPPSARYLKLIYNENLRLYCLLLTPNIVVLFNGGIKTTRTAQDCPNVGPHFKLANLFASKIERLIITRELTYSSDGKFLNIPDDLEINY